MREKGNERGWIAGPPQKAAPASGASFGGIIGRCGSFFFFLCILCCLLLLITAERAGTALAAQQEVTEKSSPRGQSQEEAGRKSSGCISCHTSTVEPTMHPTKTLHLGCTDCHGGNSLISSASGDSRNSAEYNSAEEKGQVQPRDPRFIEICDLPEPTFSKWLCEP